MLRRRRPARHLKASGLRCVYAGDVATGQDALALAAFPWLKTKNFAGGCCARLRSIDRAPPGGGLRVSDRPPPPRPIARQVRPSSLVAWSAYLARQVARAMGRHRIVRALRWLQTRGVQNVEPHHVVPTTSE